MTKQGPGHDLRDKAAALFIYALPLFEVARTRQNAFAAGQPVNAIRHDRALADATTKWVTTPNNDTLYSNAWLDLTRGPVTIALPAAGERYVSVALMDAFSNNFAILHPGRAPSQVTLALPADATFGVAANSVIVAPTSSVWLLQRTYIENSADLDAARAAQDGVRIVTPPIQAPTTAVPVHPLEGDVETVFRAMAALVTANPKPDEDDGIRRSLALLGLAPASGTTDPAVLEAGRDQALKLTRPSTIAGVRPGDRWRYSRPNLGDFGRDYLLRAQVGIGGLAALPPSEAIYMRSMTPEMQPFYSGGRAYRLQFAPGQEPPVQAFWSLSLYEPASTGALFFFDNPSNVYAIKSGPELKRKPDGSVDIVIAHHAPADPDVNWLPAPLSKFALTFRAYLPAPELLDRRYRMPTVDPLP